MSHVIEIMEDSSRQQKFNIRYAQSIYINHAHMFQNSRGSRKEEHISIWCWSWGILADLKRRQVWDHSLVLFSHFLHGICLLLSQDLLLLQGFSFDFITFVDSSCFPSPVFSARYMFVPVAPSTSHFNHLARVEHVLDPLHQTLSLTIQEWEIHMHTYIQSI